MQLCRAYTDSINKGSIPCIQSAWNYLCENEGQKAVDDAFSLYKATMGKAAITGKRALLSLSELKKKHKEVLTEALALFAKIIVGDTTAAFELKVKEAIGKEYQYIKR